MTTFGAFIKGLRIKKQLTLREFCRLSKIDPSNWSKIERDMFPPPKSKGVLEEIAVILGVAKDSEDWNMLMDLAAITYIPKELLSDQTVLEKLPVFFRTMRGQKPSDEELEALIKLLREN